MKNQFCAVVAIITCLLLFGSSAALAAHSHTPPPRTGAWYTSYYGTTNTTDYNTAAADWVGGEVYLDTGKYKDQLGNSSNQEAQALNTDPDDNRIVINPEKDYRIKSIKWAEASWGNPGSITVGTWTTITGFESKPARDFDFKMPTTSSTKKYVIWVVFESTASTSTSGGQVGAWWGTNIPEHYDNPAANGKGGVVKRNNNMDNGVADDYKIDEDDTKSFEVRPAHDYKIIFIRYGETLSPTTWTEVSVPADPTDNKSFNISITGGKQYVIWVLFASTSATQFTVTGAVDTASDAECNPATSTVSPASKEVNSGSTGSFTFSTATSCIVGSVEFNGVLTTTPTVSGNTYTTPVITGDSSFKIKFIKNTSLRIAASTSGDTSCGTLSPTGSVAVNQGANQLFTVTVNSGCAIAHVYVTDTDKGYSNVDVAPLTDNKYTFTNLQVNGAIEVNFTTLVPAEGKDYCQIPPFVKGQSNLKPNVLIIFDNSGSMGGSGNAYYRNNKPYNCTSSHNKTTNICDTIFYGYFDPYTMYSLSGNVYTKASTTLNLASGGKSGNYLNFLLMDKVDIVRKVLVGGRVTDGTTTSLAGSSRASQTTKYLYTNTGKWVEYGTDEPKGLIQNLYDQVRFGLEVFGSTSNSTSDGGTIIAKLGSPQLTLVNAVEGSQTNPKTNTPIAEALYEAIRYYQAKPSAYNSGVNYSDSTWNPPFSTEISPTTDPIIMYACQKNFVLLLTDGEANSNNKLPGLSSLPLSASTDTVLDVPEWVDRIPAADAAGSLDGKYVDAVAFYGHNTDLRDTVFGNEFVYGKEMVGKQNITFYAVYAFGNGTGTKTLQMMAKYGAYESKNDLDATDPNSGDKYDSPNEDSEWDKNKDTIPDAYYEATDGKVLQEGLTAAMSSILANVSSGTAASILANSEGSGANLLQAIFYPNKVFAEQTDVNWIGELHNLWYYIDPQVKKSTVREDTGYVSGAHTLDLKTDKVVNYSFDGKKTVVTLYNDTDGDGSGDTLANSGVDPDAVQSIWKAGKNLWKADAGSRKIYTPCSIKNGSCLACIGGTCPGGLANSGMMEFKTTNEAIFRSYLQAPDATTGNAIIDYARGVDGAYRKRAVTIKEADNTSATNVWKLGDIISSTPRLESNVKLNSYDLAQPNGYGDASYGSDRYKRGFIYSNTYKNRGMVFAGANDGMLHAFNLGVLDVSASGDRKATLTGTGLGEEAWAFIPSSSLPYLKYLTDPAYGKNFHLNFVDGTTIVTDASIGISTDCSETTAYWNCDKDATSGTNWRTVVIGSMGTGGATRIKGDTTCGSNCVNTPILDPNDSSKGFGYSSYFALDVTDPTKPTLLWEFSDPALGFASSGPAVVRLATTDSSGNIDKNKNGRWFAVLASGPTGPISSEQFHGRSNQSLKVFVLDLKTGALLATIDKLVDDSATNNLNNAFASAIYNNVIDTDRGTIASAGFYQDDVVYIGYSQANSSTITSDTRWTTGGLLRLVTGEKLAANSTIDTTNGWKLSKVIDGIGPVISNVGKIVDRKNGNLWLYFGSGRYFNSGDDKSGQQRLYGIKDPCYKTTVTHADGSITKNDIDDNACKLKLTTSNLDDQTTAPSATLGATTNSGWYINLDLPLGDYDAERVLTDPVTTLNGVIYFTTFKPAADVCSFGGQTNIWATGYDNGAAPPAGRLNGKALLQLSTGSFTEVDLSKAFGEKEGRRTTAPMVGKPPGDAMPLISSSQNRPVKKMLHIREK